MRGLRLGGGDRGGRWSKAKVSSVSASAHLCLLNFSTPFQYLPPHAPRA